MSNTLNRVFETSSTSGTGTLDLDGAVTSYDSFVARAAAQLGGSSPWEVFYVIEDDNDFEMGTGTLTDATPDTLSRDTVHASSNGDALVNWGSNTKNVYSWPPASELSPVLAYSTESSTGNAAANTYEHVDASLGAVTRTLQTADIATAGTRWKFKLADSTNKLTIDTEGSETIGIDGDSDLVLGIQGQVAELYSDGTNVQIVNLVPLNHVLILDEQSATTEGGASSAGDNTRVLNTEKEDTGNNAALASNQITLNAGTYRVKHISAPAYKANEHAIKLINATDSIDIALGTNEANAGASDVSTRSFIRSGTTFSIATSKALEVEHYIQTAATTDGLGRAVGNGDAETYAVVELERIQ